MMKFDWGIKKNKKKQATSKQFLWLQMIQFKLCVLLTYSSELLKVIWSYNKSCYFFIWKDAYRNKAFGSCLDISF